MVEVVDAVEMPLLPSQSGQRLEVVDFDGIVNVVLLIPLLCLANPPNDV